MAGPGFPFGLKAPVAGYPPVLPPGASAAVNLPEIQRAQMMEFSHRLRTLGLPYPGAPGTGHPPLHNRLLQVDPLFYLYGRQDPRMGFFHEEPKPSHSYIGLIAMGILSHKDKKLVLSDIYQWILDNYPYFRTRGPGWRNSIRHNLSLNDCFVKAGRAANGKGHYWAVHSAVQADFEKGDFRRRRAQRKVRKAMGLAVPDEDDSPSPPPPSCTTDASEWRARFEGGRAEGQVSPPVPVIISPEQSPDASSQIKSVGLSRGGLPTLTDRHPSLPPISHPFLPWMNLSPVQWKQLQQNLLLTNRDKHNNNESISSPPAPTPLHQMQQQQPDLERSPSDQPKAKKRAFDVESLLAPDAKELREGQEGRSPCNSYDYNVSHIDGGSISIDGENDDDSSDVEIEDLDESCLSPPITSTPKAR